MTTAIVCLMIAALLIVLTKVPVALAMAREDRGYDNRNPRAQQSRLSGYGARALAAHQNTIEAFPIFAAGVLLAMVTGAQGSWLPMLSLVFIAARLVYWACYLADIHWLRSLAWLIGFGTSIGLMLLALIG